MFAETWSLIINTINARKSRVFNAYPPVGGRMTSKEYQEAGFRRYKFVLFGDLFRRFGLQSADTATTKYDLLYSLQKQKNTNVFFNRSLIYSLKEKINAVKSPPAETAILINESQFVLILSNVFPLRKFVRFIADSFNQKQHSVSIINSILTVNLLKFKIKACK